MGDVGDYWREHREYKRAVRAKWNECPTCAINFGGNGTKVAPGETCWHCGWLSPGKRGEDREAAERSMEDMRRIAAERAERRAKKKQDRTCPHCGKTFVHRRARGQHIKDFHQRLPKEAQPND